MKTMLSPLDFNGHFTITFIAVGLYKLTAPMA
jgi:hypothetical protein